MEIVSGSENDLQYKQNSPPKPKKARRTSQILTFGSPKGKSGTFVHHMYRLLSTNVIPMRATMI